jgi:hypothetical protein
MIPLLPPPYTKEIPCLANKIPKSLAASIKAGSFPGLDPQNTVTAFMFIASI